MGRLPKRLAWRYDYSTAPVFFPTMADMQAPFEKYIESIEEEFAPWGICRIIPPVGWTPRPEGYEGLGTLEVTKPIRQYATGSAGLYQSIHVESPTITLDEFRKLADAPDSRMPERSKIVCPDGSLDFGEVERSYWKNITHHPPLYGADCQGSLFDEREKDWNLGKLDSLLSRTLEQAEIAIPGVNTPYLYVGMWRSTFAWHTEDVDLYSVNYLHFGEPKSWYSIPPAYRGKFERVVQGMAPDHFKHCHEFLRHKETLVTPQLLYKNGIPFTRMTQQAGEFVINYPGVYHAGFNHGFNVAESTNFGTRRWVLVGARAKACRCSRDSVKIDMRMFLDVVPELEQLLGREPAAAQQQEGGSGKEGPASSNPAQVQATSQGGGLHPPVPPPGAKSAGSVKKKRKKPEALADAPPLTPAVKKQKGGGGKPLPVAAQQSAKVAKKGAGKKAKSLPAGAQGATHKPKKLGKAGGPTASASPKTKSLKSLKGLKTPAPSGKAGAKKGGVQLPTKGAAKGGVAAKPKPPPAKKGKRQVLELLGGSGSSAPAKKARSGKGATKPEKEVVAVGRSWTPAGKHAAKGEAPAGKQLAKSPASSGKLAGKGAAPAGKQAGKSTAAAGKRVMKKGGGGKLAAGKAIWEPVLGVLPAVPEVAAAPVVLPEHCPPKRKRGAKVSLAVLKDPPPVSGSGVGTRGAGVGGRGGSLAAAVGVKVEPPLEGNGASISGPAATAAVASQRAAVLEAQWRRAAAEAAVVAEAMAARRQLTDSRRASLSARREEASRARGDKDSVRWAAQAEPGLERDTLVGGAPSVEAGGAAVGAGGGAVEGLANGGHCVAMAEVASHVAVSEREGTALVGVGRDAVAVLRGGTTSASGRAPGTAQGAATEAKSLRPGLRPRGVALREPVPEPCAAAPCPPAAAGPVTAPRTRRGAAARAPVAPGKFLAAMQQLASAALAPFSRAQPAAAPSDRQGYDGDVATSESLPGDSKAVQRRGEDSPDAVLCANGSLFEHWANGACGGVAAGDGCGGQLEERGWPQEPWSPGQTTASEGPDLPGGDCDSNEEKPFQSHAPTGLIVRLKLRQTPAVVVENPLGCDNHFYQPVVG